MPIAHRMQLLAPEVRFRATFDQLPYCNANATTTPWLFPYKTADMPHPYYQYPCLSYDDREVVYPADEVCVPARVSS
jgi:hypothetical protein